MVAILIEPIQGEGGINTAPQGFSYLEQVVGILSERDYTRKVTLMERSSYSTTVAEIMTAKVITVGLNNTVEECLQLMTDRHLRHLPVLDNGKLVGFISIGDLVKAAMEDQKVLIEQLKQYISG
ncbi:CBS domain-containing protein [Acinetobacter baumannii]|uniref:CBS domain-containing protein n=1 Tax=Acinetobacter baumannii TaxID=470 RepID=UPI00294AC742|nr:CBS domain-containing protein [Acinetobacter baumannii]